MYIYNTMYNPLFGQCDDTRSRSSGLSEVECKGNLCHGPLRNMEGWRGLRRASPLKLKILDETVFGGCGIFGHAKSN